MKQETAYAKYTAKTAGKSPLLTDCLKAFLTGGLICAFAEGLSMLYAALGVGEEDGKLLVPATLIFLTALLTGLGIFDRIAAFGGAGTLVPITGFANAVASPAIDCRSEGAVLGMGAKLFILAGPVILYGTAASVLWGVIRYLIR